MSAAVTASVMARRVGCLPDEQTQASRYADSCPKSGPYEQRQVAPQRIMQGGSAEGVEEIRRRPDRARH